MSLDFISIRTEGLGDSTHVAFFDGVAIVVDPQRDIDRFESVLESRDADLRLVLETHIHNDYVSGGRDLANKTGAELVMPAGAAPAFRHRPAFHHEDIELGDLVLRPIHTPGHTPEHTSYLAITEGRPRAVFSGGSLLVGSAGRTDLLGDERAESLARLQYSSVNRLAGLPDPVDLLPTHGAGSFCTTSRAGRSTSTIGEEKTSNPVLTYEDEDGFVKGQLSGLVPYPSYYQEMEPINLVGLPEPSFDLPELDRVPIGVTVIDARPVRDFAACHLTGAIGIELTSSFGTWVGWLTEHGTPLALVLNPDQDSEEAARQLARIGYDDIQGVVRAPHGCEESFRTVDLPTFVRASGQGAQILDTRAPDEWERGTIEGSILAYLPDLAGGTPAELRQSQPVWIICASGYRAGIAASLLQGRGFEPIVLVDAGVTDVLRVASNPR